MLDKNKVSLGIAPIAWTNDDMPDLGKENTFEQCVSEMALAGFTGSEVGGKYPADTAVLKKALDLRGIRICNQWFSSFLISKPYEDTEKEFIKATDFLREMGAKVIGVSEQSYSIQGKMEQPVWEGKYIMDDQEWKLLAEGLNKLGKIAKDKGMTLTFHHHMGTVVQTEEEVDRFMEMVDPELVFLLFDSGHLSFAGIDPEKVLKKYVNRVKHVHLKDIRREMVEKSRNERWSFLKGVREGVFTVPGDGDVDFAPIFRILEEAGYDVLRSMKQENVIYSEIRFAPLLSETEDMNCNKVIEAVLKGLERGKKDFGIEFGLIVCAMRHHSEEMNWRMIRTAREYLGSGVCAADLAGAEAIYPMSEFKNLFQNTHKIGMPFTIHAGECGSAQNIIDSVEAGAGRIGHGIAMRGHGDLIKELAGKGIGIEMCPISNLQTKAVAGPEEYPIREFLDGGLKVTVNTDNRTVSDTTMTKELEFIQKTYGIRDDEILCLMKNAADVAFATDSVKDKLYRIMREVYGA